MIEFETIPEYQVEYQILWFGNKHNITTAKIQNEWIVNKTNAKHDSELFLSNIGVTLLRSKYISHVFLVIGLLRYISFISSL